MKEKKKELTKEQIEWLDDKIHNGCGHHSKYLGFFIDPKPMIKKGELEFTGP